MFLLNPYIMGGVDPVPDYIAMYKFQNNSDDETGNYNGTLGNGSYTTDFGGNYCLKSSGTGSQFTTPSNNWAVNNEYGFSFWYYTPTKSENTKTIFDMSGNIILYKRTDLNYLMYDKDTGGGSEIFIGDLIGADASTWIHLVFSKDTSDVLTIYKNNGVFTTKAFENISASQVITIMNGVGSSDKTALFRFYDREILSGEVTEIYDYELPS